MAGETIKSEAVCVDIRPWSRTSHIVVWLTPVGVVSTVVKGAVRPKSAFLGQYDLNYTCEIVYYARAKGDLHALRECTPIDRRDALRDDFRELVLAGYFRLLAQRLAPQGEEAVEWYALLSGARGLGATRGSAVRRLLVYELAVLHLLGLDPEIEASEGAFTLRGERSIPVSGEVAAFLREPECEVDESIALDAARVIGVYYDFHVDLAVDARRSVLRMLKTKTEVK